ncbi:MAG: periplasmic heavy metal sensor [Hyphomicrobiaceae bacterium]
MTAVSEGSGQRPERRAPRWMKIALVVSLAFNLLAVGVVARTAWHLRHQLGFGEAESRGFQSFVRRLPAERRDEVRAIIEPRRAMLRDLRREMREARAKVRGLFVAEPFDATAFRAAHAGMVAAETRLREASQGVFPDIAEKLSAEDRRRLADWRERRQRWRERWRRHRDRSEHE